MRITFTRKYRSRRNVPASTISSRLRCVANSTRAFNGISRVLPSRVNSLCCSTRSSFT